MPCSFRSDNAGDAPPLGSVRDHDAGWAMAPQLGNAQPSSLEYHDTPNPPQNHPPGSTATEPPKHPKTQKPNFTHSSHFQNRPKPIHNLFTVPKLLISVAFYGVDTPKTVNLVNNPPTLFTFAKNTPFCLSYANLRRLHRDPGHSTKISRKPRLQVHHSGSLRRPVQGRKPLVSLRNNAIPARPARGR